MKHITFASLAFLLLAACSPMEVTTPQGVPTPQVAVVTRIITATPQIVYVTATLGSTDTPTFTSTPTATRTPEPSATQAPLPSFEQEFGSAMHQLVVPIIVKGREYVHSNGGSFGMIDGNNDPVYKIIADYVHLSDYTIKMAEVTAPININQASPNRVQLDINGFNVRPPFQLLLITKLGPNFMIVPGGWLDLGTLFRAPDESFAEIDFLWGVSPQLRTMIWVGDENGNTMNMSQGGIIKPDYWYVWDIRKESDGTATLFTHFPKIEQNSSGNLRIVGWITEKQGTTRTLAATRARPESPDSHGHFGSAYGKGFSGSVYSGTPVFRSNNPF